MADKDPLFDDPIGGKPPIDVAQERAAEEAEPLGYVDPESQKDPDAQKKTAKKAVTRDDAKEA